VGDTRLFCSEPAIRFLLRKARKLKLQLTNEGRRKLVTAVGARGWALGLSRTAIAHDRALAPEQWEERLVDHYLRSDGPLGGAPLTSLDATPAEIAIASGVPEINEVEAQAIFLAHFDRVAVHEWLAGDARPPRADSNLPTYFRYLVLTCLVSATDRDAGHTQNFRIRLGELLGHPGGFNNVGGVNNLWQALRCWSEKRRAKGEPIRRIELPSYGTMTLIGHAVRIAFPSWDDRRALTHILRKIAPDVRRNPVRLVYQLSRQRYSMELPTGVANALSDFSKALAAGQRMLNGHRFWRLVTSIGDRLEAEAGRPSPDRWRLCIQFCGFEQDDVRVRLFRGRKQLDDAPSWQGSLQQFALVRPSALPSMLATTLDKGFLLLAEGPGATWQIDDARRPEAGRFVMLVRSTNRSMFRSLHTNWRELDLIWSVSEVLGWDQIKGLAGGVAAQLYDDRLEDLSIENGIRLSKSVWLGRPGFLPCLTASDESSIAIEGIGREHAMLTLLGRPPAWKLETQLPVSGHWRITATEAEQETERRLCLEANAPERWDFPEVQDLDPETELLVDRHLPERTSLTPREDTPIGAGPMEHVLEAIYTSPPKGWGEADLVSMLSPVMPSPHFVWDVLRSLAEAAWLEPMLSRSWRARTWRLCAPQLIPIGPKSAIVEGALGASARQRLAEAVASAGGRTFVHWRDPSQWVAPLVEVDAIDLPMLSSQLGWTIVPRTFPLISNAPSCWPTEVRSEQGRIVGGCWNFDLGLFLPRGAEPSSGEVNLDRLVRERMDDRDLFRVRGGGPEFVSSSRTTGILEAYRRRQEPLFKWTGNYLMRTRKSGHLPLPIGSWLRRRFLIASGPTLQPDGSWSYLYPSDAETARSLESVFGKAIAGPKRLSEPSTFIARATKARREGRPPSWYINASDSRSCR
jgi:hypothetical protein